MSGSHLVTSYCPQGCYWPCEHRYAGALTPPQGRWTIGPGTGDDPEQLALDEWQLYSVAGIVPAAGFPTLKFCSDCGCSFADFTEHAREHERTRQLDSSH
jgi:hypothetical protein